MSKWWESRSSSAVVISASPNTRGYSLKAKLEPMAYSGTNSAIAASGVGAVIWMSLVAIQMMDQRGPDFIKLKREGPPSGLDAGGPFGSVVAATDEANAPLMRAKGFLHPAMNRTSARAV
ncbi:hypothetical protein [Chenggangzhangella methanolivorans]|uniref:hypothetical protein n=1 Tax=Chenggangzhangella methanolivorans TaxID=1437009 RepID=UPI003611AF13